MVEEVVQPDVAAASNAQLRAMLEFAVSQSSAIFYVADLTGERPVRLISPNVEMVTGHKASAFLEDAAFKASNIHPDDLAVYERSLQTLQEQGAAAYEYRFRTSSGDYTWFQDELRLIHGAAGSAREFAGCMTEIAEGAVAKAKLHESKELVRQVLEACPVAVTMNRVDDGVIIYESPAAQAMLNYGEAQQGQSVISRWANPEDRQAYLVRLRRDRAVDGLKVRYRKADGEEFWCALSSRLIDYCGEQVIVSNLYDLTADQAAEAELERQREILHQSDKLSALGELLAGVSHELNNPLSVLVGQALMLQEVATDDLMAERAEMIGKAADRCSRIVKTFLAMARQEPSEMAPLDLNAIVHDALEITAYSLRTSGIDVSVRLAKDLPPVSADEDQMRQVLTNLIINARHALHEVGAPRRLKITSSYRGQTGDVVVKVKDNGPGMPPEIRTRVFEPLFTTKEVGEGTGMGLALCHRIIEAHGGSITADEAQGGGAVLVIRLPRAKPESRPQASPKSARNKTAKCRVLVIDDERDVGQVIADVLENDGHAVEIVGSGSVALEKLKWQRYDVILSDIRMPGMDGPGFYRVLSDTNPEQIEGLAFITGDTLSPRVKEFLDASERPYLEKPLAPRDIIELVDLMTRRTAT